MLGYFGFSVGALVLLAYSFSAKNLASKVKGFSVKPYYAAYLVMTAALLVWAAGTQMDEESLKKAVVLGDILVLVATVLLSRVIAPKKYLNTVTFLAATLSAIAIVYRAMNVNSLMKDGVLVFYTPRVFGAFLVLALLLIWLRANTKFYDLVILKKPGTEVLRYSYFSANLIGYISVCAFLFARKSITIVFAFSMLVFSFLILLSLNLYVQNLDDKEAAYGRK